MHRFLKCLQLNRVWFLFQEGEKQLPPQPAADVSTVRRQETGRLRKSWTAGVSELPWDKVTNQNLAQTHFALPV